MKSFFSLHKSFGQGSLEYLLIIGGAILISAIVVFLAISSANPVSSSVKSDVLNSLCAKFSQSECGKDGFDPDFYGACLPKDCEWKNGVCVAVDLSVRTDNCFKEAGSSSPSNPELVLSGLCSGFLTSEACNFSEVGGNACNSIACIWFNGSCIPNPNRPLTCYPSSAPVDKCHNFVLDSGEVSIDCGGNCVPCEVCQQSWSGTKCCDADADNYGRYLADLRDCDFALNILDCDDSNPEINPGKQEICNNLIDDDCNLKVDCEDAACFTNEICKDYVECNDFDKDGFGKPGTNIQKCQGSTTLFDCIDSNASINPGALEVCDPASVFDFDCDTVPGCLDSDCSSTPQCLCFNDRHDEGEERVDCGGVCAASCVPKVSRPWFQRIGQNLAYNPNFFSSDGVNVEGWELYSRWKGLPLGYPGPYTDDYNVVFDPNVSHTADGSGSVRMRAPDYDFSNTLITSVLGRVPVEPGKTYTFSFYMKHDLEMDEAAGSYPSIQSWIRAYRSDSSSGSGNGVYSSTSLKDNWEEVTMFFTPQPDEIKLNLSINRWGSKDPLQAGTVWIDDVYVGEGKGFEQPPSVKKPFNGSAVRVDELGNYEVFRNGKWEFFFPFCVDQANDVSVQAYSDVGFNCLGWGHSPTSSLREAKNAVSKFNPNGMMKAWDIGHYMYMDIPELYAKTELFNADLDQLLSSPYLDAFLGYFWDNESTDYNGPIKIIQALKAKDTSHPLSHLKGSSLLSRPLNNFVDVVEQYVSAPAINLPGGLTKPGESGLLSFLIDNAENQTMPLGIGIITGCQDSKRRRAEGIRLDFYKAIIVGHRGITYYRDPICNNGYLSTTSAWTEFPKLRTEVDKMLPVFIREPHWTGWKAVSSNAAIDFGTRDNGREAFIIAINDHDTDAATTFTISDLTTYTPIGVYDFFTEQKVADITNGSFDVFLPANATRVYRLKRSIS